MNTMLVWLLLVFPTSAGNNPYQHGPFADLASCQRVQELYGARFRGARPTQCVQVLVPKP